MTKIHNFKVGRTIQKGYIINIVEDLPNQILEETPTKQSLNILMHKDETQAGNPASGILFKVDKVWYGMAVYKGVGSLTLENETIIRLGTIDLKKSKLIDLFIFHMLCSGEPQGGNFDWWH